MMAFMTDDPTEYSVLPLLSVYNFLNPQKHNTTIPIAIVALGISPNILLT
jgi:hypothetical protein